MKFWGYVLAVAAAAQAQYVGSRSCAPCHAAQYRAFRQTAMGRSLVAITPTTAPEFAKPVQFVHPKTGRRYRISSTRSTLIIEEFFLDRDGRTVYTDPRNIKYAIGSGSHARSFLLERAGRLYQAPVTFYAQSGRWDMSPGYDNENYVGFTRRITSNCLFCHAGLAKVQNAAGDVFLAAEPFAETAIGCERCHGPGEMHVAQPGRAMVNPAKLAWELRDQVCEQCHLFGAARVVQPGKSPSNYRPGENLGTVLAVYAFDSTGSEPTVTGHTQEMKQSACHRPSQGRLWCGSCHEVHARTPASEVAEFYRAKCLSCHRSNACNRNPDPAKPAHRDNNCIACHMPKRRVVESAHVTFTDHRILRRPENDILRPVDTPRLSLILPSKQDDPVVASRNLGFAYAELASSQGRNEFHRKVVDLLEPLRGTAINDAPFWQNLGEAHLALNEWMAAEGAFREAATSDPRSAAAHYGLGYVLQLRGKPSDAIRSYRRAVEIDPYKAEAYANLAAAYAALGEQHSAMQALQAALKLEPGNLKWRAAVKYASRQSGVRR